MIIQSIFFKDLTMIFKVKLPFINLFFSILIAIYIKYLNSILNFSIFKSFKMQVSIIIKF